MQDGGAKKNKKYIKIKKKDHYVTLYTPPWSPNDTLDLEMRVFLEKSQHGKICCGEYFPIDKSEKTKR